LFERCFLHIGMEKTGTTSVQTFCNQNRKQLANLGYYYSHCMGRDNHVNLIVYSRDDDKTDNQRKRALARTGYSLDKFRSSLSNQFEIEANERQEPYLLLSNEHLQSRLTNKKEKRRLKKLVSRVAKQIDIFLYIRRQDLVAVSLFGTRLLSGSISKLTNILPTIDSNSALPYFYNYLRIYEEYAEIFSSNRVHIRIFDNDLLKSRDIRFDFLDWIGIRNLEEFIFGPWQNESISKTAQFFMARMNSLNPVFHDTKPNPLRGEIDKRVSQLFPGKGWQVPKAKALEFYNHFKESNLTLFKKACLPYSNFNEDFSEYPDQVEAEIIPQDVADVGIKLFQDIVRERNRLKKELLLIKVNAAETAGNIKKGIPLLRKALLLEPDSDLEKKLKTFEKKAVS